MTRFLERVLNTLDYHCFLSVNCSGLDSCLREPKEGILPHGKCSQWGPGVECEALCSMHPRLLLLSRSLSGMVPG